MGLGVRLDGPYVEYSIPLKADDVNWTAEHLTRLVDQIRSNGSTIMNIGVRSHIGHESIELFICQSDSSKDYPPRK